MDGANNKEGNQMKKCKCKRAKCQHEWFQKSDKKPVQCPRCKSYKWDDCEMRGRDENRTKV